VGIKRCQTEGEIDGEEIEEDKNQTHRARTRRWFIHYLNKFKSQGQQPPGGHSWSFAVLTALGTFLAILLVTGIDYRLDSVKYNKYEMVVFINSMAALAAMIFSAPTSLLVQPRNIVGGHIIAVIIALLLDYAVTTTPLIPLWVAQALAPALAIFVMAKVGLIHPPACASCVIYLNGYPEHKDLGWMYICSPVLLSCFSMVLMGVLGNNISKERAYPLYW